ncbi:hypothetical protein QE374_001680 [Microbacterium sp. SORGH_AS428]|uniref:hypothetical protein n=1 Tax=Microbacterium sp. SORGH_AS_0428 TaxID=3041788 RepID=UPI002858E821|nr:hypothetical protein [Microbacterium sp. SORGH_AS_0428]MDR6199771.1 hypothetical protein [Microbacterium sp. SORGH_AS_0428]
MNSELAVIVNVDATVVAIGEITRVKEETGCTPVRIAIDMDPLRSHELLGKWAATNGSRNSSAFVPEMRVFD